MKSKFQSSPGGASLLDHQIAQARKAPGKGLLFLASTRRVQRTNLSPLCSPWLAVVVVVCGGGGGSLSLTGEVEWVDCWREGWGREGLCVWEWVVGADESLWGLAASDAGVYIARGRARSVAACKWRAGAGAGVGVAESWTKLRGVNKCCRCPWRVGPACLLGATTTALSEQGRKNYGGAMCDAALGEFRATPTFSLLLLRKSEDLAFCKNRKLYNCTK